MIFLIFSCEQYEDVAGYREYEIKKDSHYSNGPGYSELGNSYLSYDIIFDESAKYNLNGPDQADINKLFGFSDCGHHHENSARFGWRWYNNQLEILSYCYINGIRTHNYLASVELNKSYRYVIELDNGAYRFRIIDKINHFEVTRGEDCKQGLYYLLYPYFGGNQEAPHDISIFMRRIY